MVLDPASTVFREANVIYIRPRAQRRRDTTLHRLTMFDRHPGLEDWPPTKYDTWHLESFSPKTIKVDRVEIDRVLEFLVIDSYFREAQPGIPTIVYWSHPDFNGWLAKRLQLLPGGVQFYGWNLDTPAAAA